MGLTFAQPWLLLLLLLVPPVTWLALQGARGGGRRRRWLAAAIRALGLAALVGALAGAQLVRPADRLSVAFLVDVSDSVGPGAREAAAAWLRQALAAMPDGDRAGVILFGRGAMVERVPSPSRALDGLHGRLPADRTDLGAAVRLGLALLPADQQRRLVILSDGRDTEGGLAAALRMAAASGVQVSAVPLAGTAGDEVAVRQVVAPAQVRQGDRFTVEVRVGSTLATRATVRLYADGGLLAEQAVELHPGDNALRLDVAAATPGFRALRAEVEPAVDTVRANNALAAYTTVRGPARVLIVEGEAGEGAALAAALAAAGLSPVRLPPAAAPLDLPGYAAFDAVVLVDVPAAALGPRMALLQQYVRDLGRGLVVAGGEDSYGLGGYAGTPLEAALPVTMQIRSDQQRPQVALGLTLDKSGSMGRCHAAPGETTPSRMIPSGPAKIDIAKEAALQSIRLLGPTDEVGIVAFDSQARWVAQRRPLNQQAGLVDQLGSLYAEGGTNIYAGLHEAVQSLLASPARVKHIILVTDGWSRTGDFDALLDQLNAAGITLSVIGAGGGAADFLRGLAERGGGRYYDAPNMDEVPRIFLRETKLALRAYVQEGRFTPRRGAPSPIVDDLDGLPPLTGYLATTIKPAAQAVLLSEQREPVLAQWQYGLGRAVAWTSDAAGRWSADWVGWEGFSRFWAQAVKWTTVAGDGDLAVQAAVAGDRASLTVETAATGGAAGDGLTTTASVLGPDGQRREQPLRQIAPGRYGAELTGLAEGAHLVTVTQRRGEQVAGVATGGLVVGYSPEYALPEPAAAPAGERWAGLAPGTVPALTSPAQAFARTGLAPAATVADLWPLLALLALLLLPLDIAARRLTLDRASLAAWRRPVRREPAAPRAPATPVLARLAAGKARGRARTAAPPGLSTAPPAPGDQPPAAPAPPPATLPDTIAWLRERRQRRRD
jgi:hypothetical protein